ncbi:U3 small nucleolar RNA-associated protein 6 homolog [Aphis gossypii]|uniref:U3 small nucleolar RNA-associated protein 6 homolog n=1 Tax=Aphis gossypii TaxID=80765 RepID=UPI00215905E2|nr:U3 small nucleolar RNA-associated protein 6 homolog [Aphis gossypii]
METFTYSGAMSSEQLNVEKIFLTTYIMSFEKFKELTNQRKLLNEIILSGKATEEQLAVQINLETIILDSCKEKIEQAVKETNTGDFNTEIITILSKRINDVYMLLFKKFKYDITLVSSYLEFCSKNKKPFSEYKIVLDDIMDTFHSDPEVYITGAHHALNECNDIESARRYIAIGIKFHDDFKKLYVEEFWIEIQNLNKTGDISIQTALKKYNSIIQQFKNDIHIHIDLVDTIFNEKIKMSQLHCIIIRDMIDKQKENELMWQKLSKIHLNGYVYNYDTEIIQKVQDPNRIDCIKNCICTYNKALKEAKSIMNKRKLWELFLDDVIEIYSSSDTDNQTNKVFINKLADQTFSQAYRSGIMKMPRHFIFWADRNHYDKDRELAVLKRGLTVSNNDVDLWSKLFKYYINRDFLRNAMAVLFESVSIIKEKSLPLWEIMEFYVLNTEEDMVEKFYRQASIIVKIEEINLRFRPEYLEWRVLTFDIESGRQIFSILKFLEPKCHDLYKRMLRFETLNIIANDERHIKYMRKLYNEACNKFGHMDVELWYDCIRFEYMYGIPSLVDVIFAAGINLLEKPSYKTKLTEMKTELDVQFRLKREVIHIED